MKKRYEKPIIEQIETTDVLNMKKTYNLADIPKEFSRVRRTVAASMKENNAKITYLEVTNNSIRVHLFDEYSIMTIISSMIYSLRTRPSFNMIYLCDNEVDLIKKTFETMEAKNEAENP